MVEGGRVSTTSPASDVLRRYRDDPLFLATRSPYLVLDPGLRVVAANPAYCEATLREPAELLDRNLFDVLPTDPGLPGADAVRSLERSLRTVLRKGRRHRMPIQRYDVPAAGSADGFVGRVWLPVNSPIRGADDEVVGVLHHVEDVTDLVGDSDNHDDSAGTTGSRDGAVTSADLDGAVDGAFQVALDGALDGVLDETEPPSTHALVALLRRLREANDELLERFHRRVSIEQAKGVLMADRRCTPDDAFALLVSLSQQTNTKVHVVADAVIDQLLGAIRDAPPSDS